MPTPTPTPTPNLSAREWWRSGGIGGAAAEVFALGVVAGLKRV